MIEKREKYIGVWMLSLALALPIAAMSTTKTSAQQQRRTTVRPTQAQTAFNSGYASGYRDAFNEGQNDQRSRLNRDIRTSDQYQRGDRGYTQSMGNQSAYREGYRLGFEIGYVDGYYGRTYTATVPANAFALQQHSGWTQTSGQTSGQFGNVGGAFLIPADTRLRVRLQNSINTRTAREGDRFSAVVIEPSNYRDAVVNGYVAKLDRGGRLTGRTELLLAFETITLRNGRSGRFAGEVVEVHASDSVKSVDEEGNIESSSRTDDTTLRTGGGAALGAIIGAIAGGGKGAAIGAILGAGVGAGSVYVQGRKDLILDSGAEMTLRAAAPAETQRY
jgi:outer membrane lipoprotein SlyB